MIRRLSRVGAASESERYPLSAVFAPGQTVFVGRELERSRLCRLLLDALQGRGSVAMIAGEPGIGKSRLAQEIIVEAAKRRVPALIGCCYEGEGSAPYVPFAEMVEQISAQLSAAQFRELLGDDAAEIARPNPELRRRFDDIPPAREMPPEQEQRYFFNRIFELFARFARNHPAHLVLEDLHWADEATVRLFEHLARRLAEIPVLMLATRRDLELDPGQPLCGALESLIHQRRAELLTSRRLNPGEQEAMLRALSGQEPPPSWSAAASTTRPAGRDRAERRRIEQGERELRKHQRRRRQYRERARLQRQRRRRQPRQRHRPRFAR